MTGRVVMTPPAFLMCRPTYYGVEYEINPWMDVRRQPDRPRAIRQWQALRRALETDLGAHVLLCPARPGLPDMTFTANAGLVRGNTFVPSRFRYCERSGETTHFTRWFRRRGYRVVQLPGDQRFEGAGDALFLGDLLVAGYYYRTDIQTHAFLGEVLGVQVLSVELVDEHFYHLDTCFTPFGERSAIFYPQAFNAYGIRVLNRNVPDLLPVTPAEAYQFACNSVVVGRTALIPKPCRGLARALEKRGFQVRGLDVSEFRKAGGAVRCLTLRLR